MTYTLGIDLGTTYSAAAVHRDGVTEIVSLAHRAMVVPSAVFVAEDGQVLVGEAALRRATDEPGRLAREFKRRLGDPVPILIGATPYPAEALTALLLQRLVADVTQQQGGPPGRIVLTFPANWGPHKQDLLAEAIRLADVGEGATLTEPEAAAIWYQSAERVAPGETVAVYDLGGGTFDAAVLRKTTAGFELLGRPQGIERLGGIDADELVFRHVCELLQLDLRTATTDDRTARALVRLRAECVEAKEALSADTTVTVPVALPDLHRDLRLTRSELESMVRPMLQDTIHALRLAIESAGLATDDVDRVLLVGGSSRMPIVADMVSQALGRPFFVDAHPKHVVALGAALAAASPELAGAIAVGQPVLPSAPPGPAGMPSAPHDAAGAVGTPTPPGPPIAGTPVPPGPGAPDVAGEPAASTSEADVLGPGATSGPPGAAAPSPAPSATGGSGPGAPGPAGVAGTAGPGTPGVSDAADAGGADAAVLPGRSRPGRLSRRERRRREGQGQGSPDAAQGVAAPGAGPTTDLAPGPDTQAPARQAPASATPEGGQSEPTAPTTPSEPAAPPADRPAPAGTDRNAPTGTAAAPGSGAPPGGAAPAPAPRKGRRRSPDSEPAVARGDLAQPADGSGPPASSPQPAATTTGGAPPRSTDRGTPPRDREPANGTAARTGPVGTREGPADQPTGHRLPAPEVAQPRPPSETGRPPAGAPPAQPEPTAREPRETEPTPAGAPPAAPEAEEALVAPGGETPGDRIRQRWRWIAVPAAAAVIVAAVVIVGRGGGDGDDGGSATEAPEARQPVVGNPGGELVDVAAFGAGMPEHLDPALVNPISPQQAQVVDTLYDGLTGFDATDPELVAIVPQVAQSYEANEDATVWTFTLREGLRFSDGTSVLPSSFVRGWERATDPELATDATATLFGIIEGAEARLSGSTDTITGLVADDSARTLEVTLTESLASFDALVTLPPFMPMPEAADDVAGDGWDDTEMIGNGPFRMDGPRTRTDLVLVRNPEWDGTVYDPALRLPEQPFLERLTFRASTEPETAHDTFDQGEAQVGPAVLGSFQEAAEAYANTFDGPPSVSYHLQIDWDDPVLGGPENRLLRQAISLAIDREAFDEAAFDGGAVPATNLTVPALVGGNEGLCEYCYYEPEAARDVFAEWQADGGELSEPIQVQSHDSVGATIVEDLNRVGIDAVEEPISRQDYAAELASGACQLCPVGAKSYSYDSLLFELFHSDSPEGGENHGGVAVAEFDELVDQARATTDPDERTDLLVQAEQMLLNDEAAAIPLVWFSEQYYLYSDELDALPLSGAGLIVWEKVYFEN